MLGTVVCDALVRHSLSDELERSMTVTSMQAYLYSNAGGLMAGVKRDLVWGGTMHTHARIGTHPQAGLFTSKRTQ